ncbi:MAG: Flp pilus assembly protein CpaB [Pseudomonadota bacterium]
MALRLPRFRINRLWLVLSGALVMGALATWLANNYLNNREQMIAAEVAERAKGGPSLLVVVPTQDEIKGGIVSGANMATREVLTDLLYEDVISAEDFTAVEGKPLIRPVLKGRPLRRSDVIDNGPKDLASAIAPGHRALTLEIDEINSFALMLRPGNFVDLYLVAQNQGAEGATTRQEIRALLPRVKVIATGQTLQNAHDAETETGQKSRPAAYSNITVEVDPNEAARITLAQEVGKIRAVLRNSEDQGDNSFDQLAAAELFHQVGKKAGRSIEYIVGGAGNSGNGTVAPVNINLPNINIPGLSLGAATNAQAANTAATQAATPVNGAQTTQKLY